MLACSLIDSYHQSMLTSPHLNYQEYLHYATRLYQPACDAVFELWWDYAVGFVLYLKYSESTHQQPSIYISPSIYLSHKQEERDEGRYGTNNQCNASRDLDLPHSALLVSTSYWRLSRTSSGEWPGSTTIIDVTCKRGRLTTFVDTNIAVSSVT